MRLLGLVCNLTTLPHIKEICIIEMVSRSGKKILRKQLADLVFEQIKEEKVNYNEDGIIMGIDKDDSKNPIHYIQTLKLSLRLT